MSETPAGPERAGTSEHGDRAAFLGRVRARLSAPAPPNLAHPAPRLDGPVPRPRFRALDPDDLVGGFERAAAAVLTKVHRVAGDQVPPELLREIVEAEQVTRAVVSAEPEAAMVGKTLTDLGVAVLAYDHPGASPDVAAADLGVTSAVAGIAATGSVAVHAAAAGGRGASLLPRVHLCVLPTARLVPTPSEVLRPLSETAPPSNLVLISSASRSADIETRLTWGIHGPISVRVVLLGA
jgi:L-lactate utilization protein LutC